MPSARAGRGRRLDADKTPAGEGAKAGKLSREQYVQAWLKKPQDNTARAGWTTNFASAVPGSTGPTACAAWK